MSKLHRTIIRKALSELTSLDGVYMTDVEPTKDSSGRIFGTVDLDNGDTLALVIEDYDVGSVPKTWAGVMAILDEYYPEDVFPTTEDREGRDLGARIISLIRHLDAARP